MPGRIGSRIRRAAPVVDLSRRAQRKEGKRLAALGNRTFPHLSPLANALEHFADDLAAIRVAPRFALAV